MQVRPSEHLGNPPCTMVDTFFLVRTRNPGLADDNRWPHEFILGDSLYVQGCMIDTPAGVLRSPFDRNAAPRCAGFSLYVQGFDIPKLSKRPLSCSCISIRFTSSESSQGTAKREKTAECSYFSRWSESYSPCVHMGNPLAEAKTSHPGIAMLSDVLTMISHQTSLYVQGSMDYVAGGFSMYALPGQGSVDSPAPPSLYVQGNGANASLVSVKSCTYKGAAAVCAGGTKTSPERARPHASGQRLKFLKSKTTRPHSTSPRPERGELFLGRLFWEIGHDVRPAN
jgi:hypothetical protein